MTDASAPGRAPAGVPGAPPGTPSDAALVSPPSAGPRPDSVAAAASGWPPRPVRVALLLDGLTQPAWVRHALGEAVAGGWAVVVVAAVVERGTPAGHPVEATARGAYGAYLRLDARRYRPANDPERLVDLADALGGAPVVRVRAEAGVGAGVDAGAIRLTGADLAAVEAYRADVALAFGVAPPGPEAAHLAAAGVWTLDCGARPGSGAPGFWEVARGLPATESALRWTAGAPGDGVLARARSSTQPGSVTVNRAEHAWHAAHLLVAALRRFSQGGPAAVAEPRLWDRPPAAAAGAGPAQMPNTADVARLVARVGARLVRSKAAELRTVRQWYLAYHLAPEGAEAGVPSTAPERFTELLPPPDRYWADPFPVEHDGRYYVFFEEHLYSERDAHLSVAELDPVAGVLRDARVILRRDYHLSWPSVFRWQGDWYMTPETMTERAVQLYRATRFPDGWEYVGDLLAGDNFVDASVSEIDGRWWLFAGVMPHGATEASALHVYHAESPLGPWRPHARTPVAVDARAARPAGRVYRHDGAYYRPVQDGAPRYGSAMTVHRIDELTPVAFRETPVARVEPRWKAGLLGTHTLNAAGRLTLIDVLRRVPRPRHVARG